VVPLFIFKGDAYERLNNGNIAADATWRFAHWGRVYGEILVDDVQSPTSIFDDQLGNKWGALLGAQGVREWGAWKATGTLEAVAVEPWVYTHYKPFTAQAANQGHPLGNPNGPGQRTFTASATATSPWGQTLSLRADVVEQGLDSGSSLADTLPRGDRSKEGFWDRTEISPRLSAYLHQSLDFGAVEAGLDWDGRGSGNSRIVARVYGAMPRKPK
jgi:hypothetical protein